MHFVMMVVTSHKLLLFLSNYKLSAIIHTTRMRHAIQFVCIEFCCLFFAFFFFTSESEAKNWQNEQTIKQKNIVIHFMCVFSGRYLIFSSTAQQCRVFHFVGIDCFMTFCQNHAVRLYDCRPNRTNNKEQHLWIYVTAKKASPNYIYDQFGSVSVTNVPERVSNNTCDCSVHFEPECN